MKIKFNWGFGIAVTYIVFVIITLIMVSISMSKESDLVTDNYYEKEIKYQDHINTLNQTNALEGKVAILLSSEKVSIAFPAITNFKNLSGQILFYRPSNKRRDFNVPLRVDSTGMQCIETSKLEKGYWKVQVSWKMNNLDYYNEQAIIVQ